MSYYETGVLAWQPDQNEGWVSSEVWRYAGFSADFL